MQAARTTSASPRWIGVRPSSKGGVMHFIVFGWCLSIMLYWRTAGSLSWGLTNWWNRETRTWNFSVRSPWQTSVSVVLQPSQNIGNEIERLRAALEILVHDGVISAGRARELHGMSHEEQRAHWRKMARSQQ